MAVGALQRRIGIGDRVQLADGVWAELDDQFVGDESGSTGGTSAERPYEPQCGD